MKNELDYFTIEGCYGGNQDWFTNLVMHMGGCAAATACDSCIYFGLQNEKMKPLYPFDIECLTKEDYKACSPYTNKKMEKCTSKQQLMGKATPSNLKTSGTPAAKKKEDSYALHHTTIN